MENTLVITLMLLMLIYGIYDIFSKKR